jgi:hypothetical protein
VGAVATNRANAVYPSVKHNAANLQPIRRNMVKVIKSEPDKSVKKEVVCKYCGSTLEYAPVDVMRDYYTDYYAGKDYYHFIKCPACTCEVRVKG